ncbi:hypothetical protein B0H21DRAFT_867805 [Amylocystis lapponica]|nr:hypothetical protein B0H21DRAFT_867805 [Amylocystis lapponica]
MTNDSIASAGLPPLILRRENEVPIRKVWMLRFLVLADAQQKEQIRKWYLRVPTSSKSNDYSANSNMNASLNALLLNKVVVGKGYKVTVDQPSLTAPPAGYDSILAETGVALNYDECVVYNNDAIRPSFLVMYG